ncbi:MAG: hypothetical protein AB8I56_06810, partial [Anaerolineales bacterium]
MNIQSYKIKSIYWLFLLGMTAMILLIIGLLVTNAAAASVNSQDARSANDVLGSKLLSDGGSFDGCMVERFNQTKPAKVDSLNCTSNDVSLATYILESGPSTCIEGEDITVTLLGKFIATASERWDVGLFVSTDGGSPNTLGGSCYNDYFHPT